MKQLMICVSLVLAATAALAQPGESSSGFCLFALPPEAGVQRYINLGIVQFVETRADEVKISFGGGNLGAGHEAHIPVRNKEEGDAILVRLRRSAAACAGSLPNLHNSGDKP